VLVKVPVLDSAERVYHRVCITECTVLLISIENLDLRLVDLELVQVLCILCYFILFSATFLYCKCTIQMTRDCVIVVSGSARITEMSLKHFFRKNSFNLIDFSGATQENK